MDKGFHAEVLTLMSVYRPYFVKDFAQRVTNMLKADFPVSGDVLDQVVTSKMESAGCESFTQVDVNPVTRFLYECAEFALENKMTDPTSRETYDAVKLMDSIHHDDIQQIVYDCAKVYQTTLDGVVLSVIANDSKIACEQIMARSESRMVAGETGTRLHIFNWGMLNDGMWLNTALSNAYDKYRLFKPDVEMTGYYASSSFNYALSVLADTAITTLDKEQQQTQYSLLTAQLDETLHALGSEVIGILPSLKDLIFGFGHLKELISYWSSELTNSRVMVSAISQISFILKALKEVAAIADTLDEDIIAPAVKTRLLAMQEAFSLCLLGYEALRETRYKDTLVFYVDAPKTDTVVDMMINGDNVSSYYSAGGSDSDLSYTALYLAASVNTIPGMGMTVEWAVNRRSEIVPEMISEESERLAQLRVKDTALMQADIVSVLSDFTKSYLSVDDVQQIPGPLSLQIRQISQKATQATKDTQYNLETDVFLTLAKAANQPFVLDTANAFVSSLENGYGDTARTATLVSLAVDDALCFTGARAA